MTKITELVEDKFTLSPADAARRNIGLLRTAMELLYATYIVDDAVAVYRGNAIQALESMSIGLGGTSLIEEWERFKS